jgi:hypothetical protein
MRAGRCAQLLQLMRGIWGEWRGLEVAGHTSPTLGVGGNLLWNVVQFGSVRVAHPSRMLAKASRDRGLLLGYPVICGLHLQQRLFRRDVETSTRDRRATQSGSLHYSSSRHSLASRRKPHRLLYPAKRKLSKLLSRRRDLIFRSINHRRA